MFFMTEEAFNEWQDEMSGAYAERCKETLRAELRAEHDDPHGMEWDEADRVEGWTGEVKASPVITALTGDEPPF